MKRVIVKGFFPASNEVSFRAFLPVLTVYPAGISYSHGSLVSFVIRLLSNVIVIESGGLFFPTDKTTFMGSLSLNPAFSSGDTILNSVLSAFSTGSGVAFFSSLLPGLPEHEIAQTSTRPTNNEMKSLG